MNIGWLCLNLGLLLGVLAIALSLLWHRMDNRMHVDKELKEDPVVYSSFLTRMQNVRLAGLACLFLSFAILLLGMLLAAVMENV